MKLPWKVEVAVVTHHSIEITIRGQCLVLQLMAAISISTVFLKAVGSWRCHSRTGSTGSGAQLVIWNGPNRSYTCSSLVCRATGCSSGVNNLGNNGIKVKVDTLVPVPRADNTLISLRYTSCGTQVESSTSHWKMSRRRQLLPLW